MEREPDFGGNERQSFWAKLMVRVDSGIVWLGERLPEFFVVALFHSVLSYIFEGCLHHISQAAYFVLV